MHPSSPPHTFDTEQLKTQRGRQLLFFFFPQVKEGYNSCLFFSFIATVTPFCFQRRFCPSAWILGGGEELGEINERNIPNKRASKKSLDPLPDDVLLEKERACRHVYVQ